MNNMRKIFADFWGGFTDNQTDLLIPAYQEGYAPRDAPFPRITYEVVRPDFADFSIVSASVWDKRQQIGFFGLVDDVLRQAAEKIPEEGVVLSANEEGAVWLLRNNPFISYLDDPDDQSVMRGVIRVMIKNYLIG
jgi:hypothetical protein